MWDTYGIGGARPLTSTTHEAAEFRGGPFQLVGVEDCPLVWAGFAGFGFGTDVGLRPALVPDPGVAELS